MKNPDKTSAARIGYKCPLGQRFLLLAGLSLLATTLCATGSDSTETLVDDLDRAAVVGSIAHRIEENYVEPGLGDRAIRQLQDNLARGRYDSTSNPRDLAGLLTEDLSAFDQHFHVFWKPPESRASPGSHNEESEAAWAESTRLQNFGFETVARLPGNLGYLDLRYFDGLDHAGATAVAAMTFLSRSDAVIIDLRQNGGGEPTMVQLLASYFFGPERVHYNSFYSPSAESMEQFWTLARVEGDRMPQVPLYILTSRRTGSAAEAFSYAMQALERATILGSPTAGAANPGETFEAIDGFSVFISTGKPVNPITGTNWEKKGVQPDIEIPSVDALEQAQILALESLLEQGASPIAQLEREWALEALQRARNPISLKTDQLAELVGIYGNRKIAEASERLTYQRADRRTYFMVPLGADRFLAEGKDGFRIRFERDSAGTVIRMVDMWSDGHIESNAKN